MKRDANTMTVSEAAKKWGVSTEIVRDRVKIIPGAEKRFRCIPEEAEFPPITSHKALMLMDYLTVYSEGGKPNLARTGLKASDIEPGYRYLTDMGYITGRPGKVTTLGQRLIGELTRRKTTKAIAGINAGGVNAGVEREL